MRATRSPSTSTDPTGRERLLAGAVVDASGTWTRPNPLGADGYPALGETENADRIRYGIPDLADPAVAARYAGKHVAVAGKGASAQGVLVGLARLARTGARHPGVLAAAASRRSATRSAVATTTSSSSAASSARTRRPPSTSGLVTHVTEFRTESVGTQPDGRLTLTSIDGQQVDRRRRGDRRDRVPARLLASSPRSASTSTRPSAPPASWPSRSTRTTTAAATSLPTGTGSSPSPRTASTWSG